MEIIEVEGVQLYDFKRTHYGAGTCSIRIGDILDFKDIVIFNSHFQKKIFMRSFPENIIFNSRVEAILNHAVSDFLNGERKEELFTFLDEEGLNFPDSSFFVPGTYPLAMYIQYIELGYLRCENENQPITARIRLDDCMTFYVPIYDPQKGEYIELTFIKNQNIIDVVNRMIRSAEARKEIDGLCGVGRNMSSYICFEERTDIQT